MEKQALSEKIQAVQELGGVTERVIRKMEAVILSGSDWQLFRINPYALAESYSLNADEVIEFCIAAVKVGLFDMEWNLLCPTCGQIVENHDAIRNIHGSSYFCPVCCITITTDLNEYVETSFKINSDLHSLSINPYSDRTEYNKYFFSRNFIPADGFFEYLTGKGNQKFFIIQPGEVIKIHREMQRGMICRRYLRRVSPGTGHS